MAVIAVIAFHTGAVTGGFVGVDVFFVISGFLITRLLWAELGQTGRVDLVRFYAARARRLLPAAGVVLVATALAAAAILPALQARAVLDDGLASALYVGNYRFAITGTDYLAHATPSPFQHYWSLGVEEQFYLVWPAVLLGAAALLGRSRGAAFGVAVTVGVELAVATIGHHAEAPAAAIIAVERVLPAILAAAHPQLGAHGFVAARAKAGAQARRAGLALAGDHIDHPANGIGPVQAAGRPAQDFHPLDAAQRNGVQAGTAAGGRANALTVDQHQRLIAVGPANKHAGAVVNAAVAGNFHTMLTRQQLRQGVLPGAAERFAVDHGDIRQRLGACLRATRSGHRDFRQRLGQGKRRGAQGAQTECGQPRWLARKH